MTDSRPDTPEPTLEEAAPGVFAYLQLHGQWGLNNAAFITAAGGPSGHGSTTLIDTCCTERRARALRDTLARTSPDAPVRVLINTHHHGDHTHGNYLFNPVAIIGHERCREEIIATGLGTTAVWPDTDWGHIEIVPPNVTFTDRITTYAGDLELQLIYVGPAHTTNDIIAWLPEHRIVFAGDTVFNGGTPFCVFGSLSGSLAALEVIRSLAPKTIVPGHGPLCGPEALDTIEAYLTFVAETAAEGHAAGVTPLDLARQTPLPDPFAALHDSERFVANLHRAYSELDGAPPGTALPMPAIFPDMVAYNGGKMPACLA
ncbi:MAG TPA: MBL fold metallo-hydrolase [Dehalococcoidia bacterium]|nr:MBL fold metallo-hydrolase [Dehalococcoidia bacterium]